MNSKANQKNRSRFARFAAVAIVVSMVTAIVPAVSAQDTTTGSTSNGTPVTGSVYYYTSDPSGGSASTCASAGQLSTINPTSGTTTTVFVCVEVTDANGYEDVCDSGAQSTADVRTFSVTNATGTSVSDATHPKTDVTLTCQQGSGTAVALVGSFDMEYWRPAESYNVPMTVKDVTGAQATTVTGTFTYAALTSLDTAGAQTINLGSALAPGANGDDVIRNVYNKGNTAFTLHVSGTDLSGNEYNRTIAAANLKFTPTVNTVYGSKTALTSATASTGLSVPVETADGATARSLYFELGVPSGSAQWIPKDTYSGSVTFATG